jgi:anti-anti-sigma regulatory factor
MANGDVDAGDGASGAGAPVPLLIEARQIAGGLLIRILDDLDIATAGRAETTLETVVADAVPADGGSLVVVDLGACFVDMAGLMPLIAAGDVARRLGGTLVVVGLPSVWERVLPTLGLDERLQRRPDLSSAVADFGPPPEQTPPVA